MIETETNLDEYIDPLRLHFGDVNGTMYSTAVYRTALINAVKYLAQKWESKYLIDTDNNVYRNPLYTFYSTIPPLVEIGDQYALILAATVILRQIALTSSSDEFSIWKTPDLEYSNVAASKVKIDLWRQANDDLKEWFRVNLGTSRKSFLYKG